MTNIMISGFYGNDCDTCYVAPSGRIWLVASADEISTVQELTEMPDGATDMDEMVTPQEAINWVRQVETESGETILESV